MNNRENKERTMESRQDRRKRLRRKSIMRTTAIAAITFVIGCGAGSSLQYLRMSMAVGNLVEMHSHNTLAEAALESSAEQEAEIVKNETDVSEDALLAEPEESIVYEIDEIEVGKPVDYSIGRAISMLKERANSDERYATILENQEVYQEKMLINLVNNPETLDFVYEFPEKYPVKGDTKVTLTERELEEVCPLFLQWDKRWGYESYGDESTIAVSGCGPTALSMAIVGLTHNEEVTPDAVARFAMENEYYMYGTGTLWKLMTEGASHFGVNSEEIITSKTEIEKALDDGAILICSVRGGDFTTVGHFIVIYGYDEDGLKINDPFCVYKSRQTWDYNKIRTQIKCTWALRG